MSADKRSKLITDTCDPELAEDHNELVSAYFVEMRQEGHNLEDRDCEMLMKHQKIRRRWFELQIQQGRKELEEVKPDNQIKEEDALAFDSVIDDVKQELQGWEARNNDTKNQTLGKAVLQIINLFHKYPQLINMVLEGDRIDEILREGLQESNEVVIELENHFWHLDDDLRATLMEKVDALDLRFNNRAADCQQVLDAADREREKIQTEVTELKEQISQRDIEIQRMAEQDQQRQQRDELSDEVAQLKSLNAKLEYKCKEFNATLEQKGGIIEKLEAKLQEAESERDDLRFKSAQQTDANRKTLNSLDQRDSMIRRLDSRTQLLDSSATQLTAEAAEARRHRDEVQRQLDEQTTKLNKSESNCDRLDSLLTLRNSTIAALQPEAAKANKLQDKVVEQASTIGELQTAEQERNNAQNQVREFNKTIVNLNEKLRGVHEELRSVEGQRDSYEKANADSIKEFKRVNSELTTTKDELITVKDKLATANNELTKVNDKLAQLAKVKDELATTKDELAKLTTARDELTKARDQLNTVENKLTKVNDELNAATVDKDSLTEDLRVSKRETEDAHSETERLRQERNSVASELEASKEQLEQASTDREAVDDAHAVEMTSANSLLGQYTSEVNGMSSFEDLSSFDAMVYCQKNWMSLRLEHDVSPVSEMVRRRMPKMMFVQDRTPLDPVTHAMNIWMAIRQHKPWFADSQALFNADLPVSHTAEVYHWVFDALDMASTNIRSEDATDQSTVLDFKTALAILQGIAYIGYLARSIGVIVSPIQKLLDSFAESLRRLNFFGPGSVVESIFVIVQSSLEGDPIPSWVSTPTSALDNEYRLDESDDSAIGVGRCIIGDPVAIGNFVLIDQIGNEEILYSFTDQEVDRIYFALTDISTQLVFSDSLVSRRLGNELCLTPVGRKKALAWAWRFLTHKFT
ncbi:MAG: hypothetical protein Q9207_006335 [Kuettlingeria erythrocarpa]